MIRVSIVFLTITSACAGTNEFYDTAPVHHPSLSESSSPSTIPQQQPEITSNPQDKPATSKAVSPSDSKATSWHCFEVRRHPGDDDFFGPCFREPDECHRIRSDVYRPQATFSTCRPQPQAACFTVKDARNGDQVDLCYVDLDNCIFERMELYLDRGEHITFQRCKVRR